MQRLDSRHQVVARKSLASNADTLKSHEVCPDGRRLFARCSQFDLKGFADLLDSQYVPA